MGFHPEVRRWLAQPRVPTLCRVPPLLSGVLALSERLQLLFPSYIRPIKFQSCVGSCEKISVDGLLLVMILIPDSAFHAVWYKGSMSADPLPYLYIHSGHFQGI